jgi:hypothetical protein
MKSMGMGEQGNRGTGEHLISDLGGDSIPKFVNDTPPG